MACDKVIDKAQADRRPPARGGRGRPRVRRRRVPREGHARPRDAARRRSRSRRSPPTTCPTASSRTSRRRSPTTRRTSRGRSARTSAWSRSTPRPVRSTCCSYVAVDDCGNQINPLIVEGQVHGGIIQGLAQALFEEAVYDDDGNLQTSTLADYLVPAAADVPSITTRPHRHPIPTNPLGREGHRRGRHDRRGPGRHQRRRRRAVAPRRHRHRHAGHARSDVWEAIQAATTGGNHVIPAAFDYVRAELGRRGHRASSARHGDDAKFLAGGHSLLPLMKLRLAQPRVLVDIGRHQRPVVHPRRRRPHRHRRADPPPRRRDQRPARRARAAAGARRRSWSATRRCVTAARSAARSPTATRRPTCRPRCWRSAPPSSRRAPTGDPRDRGRRLLHRASSRRRWRRRDADRDPRAQGAGRRLELPEVQPAGPGLGHRRRRRWRRNGSRGIGLVNMGSTPILPRRASSALWPAARRSPTPPTSCRRRRAAEPTSTPVAEYREHLAKVLTRRAVEAAA